MHVVFPNVYFRLLLFVNTATVFWRNKTVHRVTKITKITAVTLTATNITFDTRYWPVNL